MPTIPVEQRLAGVNPTDVMNYFKPEERLMGLKPEERLAGLSPEDIENYLKTLKKG